MCEYVCVYCDGVITSLFPRLYGLAAGLSHRNSSSNNSSSNSSSSLYNVSSCHSPYVISQSVECVTALVPPDTLRFSVMNAGLCAAGQDVLTL